MLKYLFFVFLVLPFSQAASQAMEQSVDEWDTFNKLTDFAPSKIDMDNLFQQVAPSLMYLKQEGIQMVYV